MYTQSFNVPDQAGQKTVAVTPSTEDAKLMARFDARIDADGRIEPQDWMPEACCPKATGSPAPPASSARPS
jgi:ring-1,2-phenylacetyl-CoA epoxidase subunit PaaA